MTVFIVAIHWHYDCTDVESVWANQEDAEAEVERLEALYPGDSQTVGFQEMVVQ